MTEIKKITAWFLDEPEVATNQKIVLLAGIDAKHKIVKGEMFGYLVEASEDGVLSQYPFTGSLAGEKRITLDYGSALEDDSAEGRLETPTKPLGYRYLKLSLPPEIKAGQMMTLEEKGEKYIYKIGSIEEPFGKAQAMKTKTEPTKSEKPTPALSIADNPKK